MARDMDKVTSFSEGKNHTCILTEDSGSIHVEDPELRLANSITEQVRGLPQISPDCCIYRVPPRHHKLNENAYTPQRVSIGPLHHGKEELQDMEATKLRYLQAFLNRTHLKLEACIKVIKECEERARRCYEKRIDFSSDELVKLFLVDSCFIIEAMLRSASNTRELVEQINPLNNPEMIFHLQRDMILLENQLPFFVIDGLFTLAFPTELPERALVKLSVGYFTDLMLVADIKDRVRDLPPSSEVNHFVDLLRICHLPSTRRLTIEDSSSVLIRNVVELQNAGLNFRSSSSNFLLDVTYRRGTLEIPRITLTGNSGCLLRNLMVLEQCKNPYDTYINDYVMFMDRLIDSAKDVDILVQNGIIDNVLSDSSVAAALLNDLGNQADLWALNYYYGDVSNQIIAHCDIPWNRWKAALKRDYLSTPWMIASTTAAVILLLLTLIQTICSVVSL